MLNVVDFAILIWSQMQVDYAAAAGAQAAYNTCQGKPNCRDDWPNVVTVAAQSTSLGSAVTSAITERYYCTVGTTLQPQGGLLPPPPPLPTNCSAQGGDPSTPPGDYVTVSVNYTFTPLFSGLSARTAADAAVDGHAEAAMTPSVIARLGACRQGVSAIEMALVLTIFLGLLFGIINFSLLLWTQASLYYAVQAAARSASVNPTNSGTPADPETRQRLCDEPVLRATARPSQPFQIQQSEPAAAIPSALRWPDSYDMPIPFYGDYR